jgi:hypothetical protein
MQDNFSIRNWKHTKLYKEEFKAGKLTEQEEFETDSEDIEFEIPGSEDDTPVVDKELNKSLSKQDAIIKNYQDINAMMQKNLKNYIAAKDEDTKDIFKMALKQLTPEYQAAKNTYEKLKGVKL